MTLYNQMPFDWANAEELRGKWCRFRFRDEELVGQIVVFDRYGGGLCNTVCPSVDIEVVERRAWYKHIPCGEVLEIMDHRCE